MAETLWWEPLLLRGGRCRGREVGTGGPDDTQVSKGWWVSRCQGEASGYHAEEEGEASHDKMSLRSWAGWVFTLRKLGAADTSVPRLALPWTPTPVISRREGVQGFVGNTGLWASNRLFSQGSGQEYRCLFPRSCLDWHTKLTITPGNSVDACSLGPHLRPPESEVGPVIGFNRPSRGFRHTWKIENYCSRAPHCWAGLIGPRDEIQ